MNLTNIRGSGSFWDEFAPWYERWQSRNGYHRPLIGELAGMVEPGWRVLDVGAATGVLSLPLASLGCRVLALEPSGGMRDILGAKLSSLGMEDRVTILPQTWEGFLPDRPHPPDLVLACNSLHLTFTGIKEGMNKAFAVGASYAALMTEINQSIFIDFKTLSEVETGYEFLYIKIFSLDSSFLFESHEELALLETLLATTLSVEFTTRGLVQSARTDVAVLWWKRAGHVPPGSGRSLEGG